MAAADTEKKTGFNAPAVVLCSMAAILFVYALSLFIEGGYNAALNRELEAKIYTAGVSDEILAERAAQQALLDEQVRYLDPEAGVLCLPIDDAMERVVVKNAR
jgi:hypothetical protein